jgi:hypothetical protein
MKLTALIFATALAIPFGAAHAQDYDDPQRGPIGPNGPSSSPQSTVIEQVRIAIQNPRNVIVQRRRPELGYYNLVVENLCSGNQLADKLVSWVREAPSGFWSNTTRVVALVAVVSAHGKPQFKIPIITLSNETPSSPLVRVCGDQFIITDVPYNLNVRIHFEFATKEERTAGDLKPVLDALLVVATAAAAVQSGGGSLVVGAAGGLVVNFLKVNSPQVAQMTGAVNSLLNLMNRQGQPVTTSIVIENAATKLEYRAKKTNVFVLNKMWRPAKAEFDPNNGYTGFIEIAYKAAYDNKSMFSTFGVISAAQQEWTAKPEQFCNALRTALNIETGGDRYAVLVALSTHASYYAPQYLEFPKGFKDKRKTCLYRAEEALLRQDNWPEPFAGAWAAAGS